MRRGLVKRGKPMADLQDLISRLKEFVDLEPPYQRWLAGEGADPCLSYCEGCAEKAVADGKGDFIDGGFPGGESDGCEHCEICGCLLHYSLTDYGALAELAHFAENPPKAPVSKEMAYHVLRVLVAEPDRHETVKLAQLTLAEIGKTSAGAEDG